MTGASTVRPGSDAWDGAIAMMRRRLATVEGLFGPDHADTAECHSYLGALLLDVGRVAEAEPCFRRAYAIRCEAFGAEDPDARESLDSLVGAMMGLEDYVGAEPLLWRELAMVEREEGRGHPDVAPVLVCLSECVRVRGEVGEAIALLERALTILRAHEGDDSEDAVFAVERIEMIRGEVVALPPPDGGGDAAAAVAAEGERC